MRPSAGVCRAGECHANADDHPLPTNVHAPRRTSRPADHHDTGDVTPDCDGNQSPQQPATPAVDAIGANALRRDAMTARSAGGRMRVRQGRSANGGPWVESKSFDNKRRQRSDPRWRRTPGMHTRRLTLATSCLRRDASGTLACQASTRAQAGSPAAAFHTLRLSVAARASRGRITTRIRRQTCHRVAAPTPPRRLARACRQSTGAGRR